MMPGSDTASMAASSAFGGMSPGARPVFIFPANLEFYLEDQTTHKRVLTLYNPYDTEIIFKVLCNNPKKYAVVEPEGRIAAQKCIDIVVRHVAVSPSAVQQTDKFRIQIFDEASPEEIVGKRDVLATLHPGVPDPSDHRHSSSLPHHRVNPAGAIMPPQSDGGVQPLNVPLRGKQSSWIRDWGDKVWSAITENYQQQQPYGQHPNLIACFAAIVCIIALFLPTEGDTEQQNDSVLKNYPYLHLTVNQKLVFAYVLGLVTMAILKTT